MKRWLILLLVVLAMLALVGLAFAWDCVRIAANHRERIALADAEVIKHEERLVTLLRSSPQLTDGVKAAIAKYEAADTAPARLVAYDDLVVAFRTSMSDSVDPTNPLERKFMDDIAGVINRREIACDPRDEEWTDYRQFLAGFRGRVARSFSSRAQSDFSSSKLAP